MSSSDLNDYPGGARIIDYDVVSADEEHQLQYIVVRMIHKGWQPLGGVAYTGGGELRQLMQAMVKYERSRFEEIRSELLEFAKTL